MANLTVSSPIDTFMQSATLAEARTNLDIDYEVTLDQYGAVGDGATDDSTAIQSALDSGAKLVKGFPGKTYIAKNLSTSSAGQTIDLNGATLKAPNAVATGEPIITLAGSGQVLRNGTIDGNQANSTNPPTDDAAQNLGGVVVSNDDIDIYRVKFVNHEKCAITSGGSTRNNTSITHCEFEDGEDVSIFLFGVNAVANSLNGVQINDNRFNNTYGIFITGGNVSGNWLPREIQIHNNRFINGPLVVVRGARASIQGNYWDMQGNIYPFLGGSFPDFAPCITYDSGRGGIIANNYFRGFRTVGCEVTGNTDSSYTGGGAIAQDLDVMNTFQITGNTFYNDESDWHRGLDIKPSGAFRLQGVTCTGNTFINCHMECGKSTALTSFLPDSESSSLLIDFIISNNSFTYTSAYSAEAGVRSPIGLGYGCVNGSIEGNVINSAFVPSNTIAKTGIAIFGQCRNINIRGGSIRGFQNITNYTGSDDLDTITSGTLEVGREYEITTFVAGDDFTNVGATSNATGILFVATGTTPTTWTNASTLTPKPLISEVGGDVTVSDVNVVGTDFVECFKQNPFSDVLNNGIHYARNIISKNRLPSIGQSTLTHIGPHNWTEVKSATSGGLTQYANCFVINTGTTSSTENLARLGQPETGHFLSTNALRRGLGWTITADLLPTGLSVNASAQTRLIFGKAFDSAYGIPDSVDSALHTFGIEIRVRRVWAFYYNGSYTRYVDTGQTIGTGDSANRATVTIVSAGGATKPSMHFLVNGIYGASFFDLGTSTVNFNTGISAEVGNPGFGTDVALKVKNIWIEQY